MIDLNPNNYIITSQYELMIHLEDDYQSSKN